MTAADAPNADVLDREEQTVAEKKPAADAPVADTEPERPGIRKATAEELAEEPDAVAPTAAFDPDYLSLEELLEQVKVKKPELGDEGVAEVRKLYESINERTGNKLAIPRTIEGATKDNADLALELHGLTQTTTAKSVFTKAVQSVFTSASNNGIVKMRESGVTFHAEGKGPLGLFMKKPFTQDDARQIALLAMHNKDLLPPNAIKITGNKDQRAMIKAEIDKLNEVLPDATKLTLTKKQAQEFTAAAPAPAAAAPAQAAPSAVTEARMAAMAEPATANPYQETDLKYSLAEVMSENLNEDRDSAIANAKPIGQLAKFGHDAYETTYKDSDSDATTTIQFADLGEDRGLKVIRIEPNGPFPGYQSTPYVVLDRTDGIALAPDLGGPPPAVKTPLAGNFDAAGKGAPLTQADPAFIGPREFIGPQAPAARAPSGP